MMMQVVGGWVGGVGGWGGLPPLPTHPPLRFTREQTRVEYIRRCRLIIAQHTVIYQTKVSLIIFDDKVVEIELNDHFINNY